VTMPTFADIFAEAEAIACEEQEYRIAHLITADEHQRTSIEFNMALKDRARYDAIMHRAYSRLSLKENTRGKIKLD